MRGRCGTARRAVCRLLNQAAAVNNCVRLKNFHCSLKEARCILVLEIMKMSNNCLVEIKKKKEKETKIVLCEMTAPPPGICLLMILIWIQTVCECVKC